MFPVDCRNCGHTHFFFSPPPQRVKCESCGNVFRTDKGPSAAGSGSETRRESRRRSPSGYSDFDSADSSGPSGEQAVSFWSVVTRVSIGYFFFGGLVAGVVGAIQFGIEHWANVHVGTTFLMRVSAPALVGMTSLGILLALIASWFYGEPNATRGPLVAFLNGWAGSLLGAVSGAVASVVCDWFGWADKIMPSGRDFHLPAILERCFDWHWPAFWERVAGSAASVMLVFAVGSVIGLAAIWPFNASSGFDRFGRCVLMFGPLAAGLFWFLN